MATQVGIPAAAMVSLAGAGITGFLFYRDTKRKDGKK